MGDKDKALSKNAFNTRTNNTQHQQQRGNRYGCNETKQTPHTTRKIWTHTMTLKVQVSEGYYRQYHNTSY